MIPKDAIEILKGIQDNLEETRFLERCAIDLAIEALSDNKPSRTWIAKNEYRRGWHDAITKALSEMMKVHVENETFDMVQKETLIGLGLSMDSALGAEPYSETEVSYPEPDRPHGEWKRISIDKYIRHASFFYRCSVCGEDNIGETNFCPKCGFPMNEEALEILRKREGEKE